MELNFTTFILEIINFIILVFLLTHFFYRPVMDIIAKRHETIQNKLNEAESIRNEADVYKNQYEDRLNEWKKEREITRRELSMEINDERKQRMSEVRNELALEKEKARVLAQREIDEKLAHNEKIALRQGAAFSAKLLSRLASPELETSIVQLVIEELDKLSPEQRQLLNENFGEDKLDILVCSAYPLSLLNQEKLQALLAEITGVSSQCTFNQEPDLIAGLRITIGPWKLHATVQDELSYFAESSHESR